VCAITNPSEIPTFVRLNYSPDYSRRYSRDECLSCAGVDYPRLPLPFNDADEVSCRARAIKYSRCRASFAPIRSAFAEQRLGPPQDRQRGRSIKRNKELRAIWARVRCGQLNSRGAAAGRGSQPKRTCQGESPRETPAGRNG
jgi:hypothetical protein